MVTHEHDLVRHFGGRIINITGGEIVFDEVITGVSDDVLPEEELAQAMAAASGADTNTGKIAVPPSPVTSTEDALIDEVIAGIIGADQDGGAE
jgi:cell division transport system ATP-binding protein